MKKILYVTSLNETINAFLIPHINELIKNGYIVHCACNINEEINSQLKSKNVNYHNIKFERNPLKINYFNVIKDIKKIQKQNKYEIVHVHTPIAAFLTRLALKNEDIKIIYTAHGFHFFKGAPLINWLTYYPLERLAALWTDRIITINKEDFERAKYFKLRKNGDVKLINGVGIDFHEYSIQDFDKQKYRNDLGIKNDDFVILMIADLNKNKNHIQLIKAMELLKKKYSNIKVLLAGEGPLKEELIAKVKEFNLQENIKFLGYRKDIKELINIADIGVLLSYREGLPRSIMEFMINGKKLIVTNIRGNRDLVCNEKIGKVVEIEDFNTTAKYIEYYYLNNDIKNIPPKEIEFYDLNNVIKQIKNIHEYA